MEEFTKEGRKLRPRKNAGNNNSERVEFNSEERRSFGGEHRSYGEGRGNSGERRSYGQGGEHRSYGQGGRNYGGGQRGYGEHKSYGEHKTYGEHKSYGEGRGNFGGERRSYGQGDGHRSYGEHKSYGEGRSNFSGGRSSNGEHKSYGEGRGNFGGERRSFGPKPGFKKGPGKFQGGRKPAGNKPQPTFSKESAEGINRMISRRPVVNGGEFSDADTVQTPIKDEIRLNKFIANSGVCSRREADTLIQAGVVTVNGQVVTELGTKVNIHDDDVRFNGERLRGEEKVYIIMNKPKGFVTTASDPHADKTVLDLVKGCSARVYPVGRLDKNTTGVLMLTNDGEIAERLTHPSYDKKKIYQVALDRPLSQEDYDKILEGIELSDGEVKADELEFIDENDKSRLGIEIHSGKNRIVRRIFESLGYSVKALDRVYFAGLTKKGLKKGGWRYLTESEVNILKMGAYV